MTDLNVLETMYALFGEPTNMVGLVLLYIFSFMFVFLIGTWGFVVSLMIIRRLLR